MENATKALIMAAGILIGILIIALMFTLFVSSREVSNKYEETKKADELAQFNVNFIKYVGKSLTIHEVVTICNFADINGVTVTTGKKTSKDIKEDINGNKTYTLTINSYSDLGYINSISFSDGI